ncbi:XdhC family protein [Paractinoplanes brasiliensis]|uniref:Xanthine dehydrogenase accessory factor n=1 Tax=Paractinoplanes brasiliensis TaxID=52695 RepID=A0A4V3C8D4_9ACTN|nr:XdhC/CoxI family protein [Actinoplanes brasiliensis]TDO41188.1 xanthine dehydrogenase accessory factor [Actinoplanes brasiliensis]GID26259.1 xanthine dehydrogenase accessory factor [Actinoplanes brasiliensis]
MRDVLDRLLGWWEAGEPVGLATVTATWSSAPRQPGAALVVGPGGEVVGSVSGGCVEGAVYEQCLEVVESGQARTLRYGISDDDAYEVGLTCGGIIELLVERVDRESFPQLPELAAAIGQSRPVALATRLDDARHLLITPDERTGTLGADRVDDAVTDDGRGQLAAGRTGVLHYGPSGERRGEGLSVLVASFAPPARMLVFGATDHAAATARIGSFLGYHVTVCDARPVFATARRFPSAGQVVVDWPHRYLNAEAEAGRIDERTVLCVLTHDPKFDVPVLEVALRLPVAYVGAMGSRRTHDDRTKRLQEAGLSDADLSRLASPVGLDLGARTPEETAVSIAAEIVALRWGGTGARLTTTDGRIHAE